MGRRETTTANADQPHLPVTEARFVHDPSAEREVPDNSAEKNNQPSPDGQQPETNAEQPEQVGTNNGNNEGSRHDGDGGQAPATSALAKPPASGQPEPALEGPAVAERSNGDEDGGEEVQYLHTRELSLEERQSRDQSQGLGQAQGTFAGSVLPSPALHPQPSPYLNGHHLKRQRLLNDAA